LETTPASKTLWWLAGLQLDQSLYLQCKLIWAPIAVPIGSRLALL
jgi:hypothetical protein